ncbi:Ubiquitin family protein [Pleurostoma richardsiae]|uniref:Ubiquitin family protein n=1 Tax=Pleurostoma richardsiae TaxID=41990 RepID=A0AA38RC83_9PEZI|nr:Ubiquitin family protein [Pleurostoma richardsiae]
MAQETAPSSSSIPSEDVPPLTVNLQIVSPSVGVNGPLSFPQLDSATTVRQLKQKIRDVLPMKPADDHQRLIHRGRLLARDGETLQDVFGAEVLRNTDQQTLHLVLRDTTDHHSSTQSTPMPGQSPAPNPDGRPAIPSPYPQGAPQPQMHGQAYPHIPPRFVQPGLPNPPIPHQPMAQAPAVAQQLLAQQHQTMVQWMNQIQREAGYRQMLNQNQQARAAMGMHGIQDQVPNSLPNVIRGVPGRNSPGVPPENRTFVREGVTPNGQHWRVLVNETVLGPNGAASAASRNPLSAADVRNIMRSADVSQATLAMTNAMHRSASGASLQSMNNPMGATLPRRPGSARPVSRTATPDQARTPSHGSSTGVNGSQSRVSQSQPEVYILSSPLGPRALLINNHSEMYYTPSARFPAGPFPLSFLTPPAGPARQPLMVDNRQALGQPAQQQAMPPAQNIRENLQQVMNQQALNEQPPPQPGQQVPVRPFAPPGQLHPNNPGAGALVAAIWPHFWLLVRLAALVWWFSAADTSWPRWITMISLALTVFLINTGLLNGMANQAWDPFRRHLEGLMPLGNPNQARDMRPNGQPAPEPHQGAAAGAADPTNAVPQPRQQEPDPAQAAARLVAQRREANANRLMDQIRRVERAGLLFLASIAPGVAERHIAHLEAEERRRREAEEAAAAAEAAAAEAAAAAAAAATTAGEAGEQLTDASQTEDNATWGPHLPEADAAPEEGREADHHEEPLTAAN